MKDMLIIQPSDSLSYYHVFPVSFNSEKTSSIHLSVWKKFDKQTSKQRQSKPKKKMGTKNVFKKNSSLFTKI